MTATVNQASTIAAAVAPAKGRHAKPMAGAASAFNDALGLARQRSAQQETAGHGKIKGGANHGRQERDPVKAVDAGATTRVAAADVPTDDVMQLELPAFDDADPMEKHVADDADVESEETSAAPALPPQIRAEQAITAMLAMAPIPRNIEPAPAGSGEQIVPEQVVGDDQAVTDDAPAAKNAPIAQNAPAAENAPATKSPLAATTADLHAVSTPPKGGTPADPQPVRMVATTQSLAAAPAVAAIAKTSVEPTGKQVAGKQTAIPPSVGIATADAMPSGVPNATGKVEKKADRAESGTEKPPARMPGAEAPKQPTTPAPAARTNVTADDSKRQAGSDPSSLQNPTPEPKPNETQPVAAKVTVLAQQAAPAPAAPSLNQNATAIVAAISGDHAPALPSNASLRAYSNAQPMRSLKIELHPAELGAVTANLKAAGDRLSVELQVDNEEAYHVLSTDSDAIVQSLRSLGFDIDHISIQQPQAAATIVARAEASADAGSTSRDASSFQSGNSDNGSSERSGGQASGRGDRNHAQDNDQPRQARQDRAGGGIYI